MERPQDRHASLSSGGAGLGSLASADYHREFRRNAMRLPMFGVLSSLCLASAPVVAQSIPAAIFTDPPRDAAHPAAMTVLHIPTHGVLINGLLYSPSGSGPHPTLLICHGLPGNEK